MSVQRRTRIVLLLGLLLASLLVGTAQAQAQAAPSSDRRVLLGYARDTWKSMVALTDPATGLPSDNMTGSVTAPVRAEYTSPTNIGGYLWSTVVARDTGIIGRSEAYARMSRTLRTLSTLDRHDPSGMFYNWYSPSTGAKLTVWPPDGSVVHPFLSTVDNGWLAAALMVVATAEPRLAGRANGLLGPMDFGFFYNPAPAREGVDAGFNRGGFWDADPGGCTVVDNYRDRGPDVWYTCNSYDTAITEARIALYIGIARGQIPAKAYYATWRTFPDTCDWSWQEQQPVGVTRTYDGIPVFEGAYRYRGFQVVPSWGGDMFEALMPDLFVPEAAWGPHSWRVNHPLTVRAQIEHGLVEAGYGYWGFSPASNPAGGYSTWGVEAVGMNPDGYFSDEESTNLDLGFGDCRPAGNPNPTYGDGVVTPHAVFLALPYAKDAALANLAKLRANFLVYGDGGFYDAVAVRTGRVAATYLSLDQSMVMAQLGNVLTGDLHQAFGSYGQNERRLRPVIGQEVFSAHA
jgi:hypothetical protein